MIKRLDKAAIKEMVDLLEAKYYQGPQPSDLIHSLLENPRES